MTSGGRDEERSVGSGSALSTGSTSTLKEEFRDKVKLMQSWKPGSTPSNRDRLELYAYHKVAFSGPAPSSLPKSSNLNAAERAKYQAWLSKSGKTKETAMALYVREADRQMRVYGTAAAPVRHSNNNNEESVSPSSTTNIGRTPPPTANNPLPPSSITTPRGIAAIPLLCAAVAESRSAFVQRLNQTTLETAWWKRQEPLCASPGSFFALPEYIVLSIAQFIEYMILSLSPNSGRNLIASFCWPLQKCMLLAWMIIVLYETTIESSFKICGVIVWGSKRTGYSLDQEWTEIIPLVSHSVRSMCEHYQPLTCRLVGLLMIPFPSTVSFVDKYIGGDGDNVTLASSSLMVLLSVTWWYWTLTVPFAMWCLFWMSFSVGFCFVLIEVAGV